MKCDSCHKTFKPFGNTILMQWFQLVHFVQFLHSEEQITLETYESMQDALSSFKDFAYEQYRKDTADEEPCD